MDRDDGAAKDPLDRWLVIERDTPGQRIPSRITLVHLFSRFKKCPIRPISPAE